jgi:hypothetical protein
VGGITGLATAAARYALIIRLSDGTGDEAIGWYPRRIPCLQGGVAKRTLEAVNLPMRGHGLGAPVDGSASAGAMGVGHGGALYRFS